jgi:hypothetical protein
MTGDKPTILGETVRGYESVAITSQRPGSDISGDLVWFIVTFVNGTTYTADQLPGGL